MEVRNILNQVTEAYGKNFRTAPTQDGEPRVRERTAPARQAEAQAPERANPLAQLAEPLERFMTSIGVDIKININEDTGEMQAVVRDASGEKVIRKIPSDEVLRLAASIREMNDHYLDRAL